MLAFSGNVRDPLQRRPTRSIKAVNMMDRSYWRALSYEKKEDDAKLGRSHERLTRIERRCPYVVQDGIKLKWMKWHKQLMCLCAEARQGTLLQD